MYVATVYFEGPKTIWSKKIDASEIIYQQPAPYLWLARMFAQSCIGNKGKCGYVITRGDDIIEQSGAADSAYQSV